MKTFTSLTAAIILATTMASAAPAYAQFGDLKDFAKKKAKKEAVKEIKKQLSKPASTPSTQPVVQQRTTQVASVGSSQLGAPAANLRSLTNCASLRPSNIIIGTQGSYTFSQGMSSERRSGLINRRNASLSDGCILPSLNPNEIAYMEVDTNAYRAMGGSNDWEMQCVKSANPGAGAVGQTQGKSEYPYKVTYLSGKDMMLHCGNSEGISECATGSNSNRSGAWKKKLTSQGKTMLSVYATPSTLSPAGGEKLYCHYYNKKSGTALFGFEYLRTQN